MLVDGRGVGGAKAVLVSYRSCRRILGSFTRVFGNDSQISALDLNIAIRDVFDQSICPLRL